MPCNKLYDDVNLLALRSTTIDTGVLQTGRLPKLFGHLLIVNIILKEKTPDEDKDDKGDKDNKHDKDKNDGKEDKGDKDDKEEKDGKKEKDGDLYLAGELPRWGQHQHNRTLAAL